MGLQGWSQRDTSRTRAVRSRTSRPQPPHPRRKRDFLRPARWAPHPPRPGSSCGGDSPSGASKRAGGESGGGAPPATTQLQRCVFTVVTRSKHHPLHPPCQPAMLRRPVVELAGQGTSTKLREGAGRAHCVRAVKTVRRSGDGAARGTAVTLPPKEVCRGIGWCLYVSSQKRRGFGC